ncbi:DUF3054 domain-containing protein [Glutamicibacter sp. NPDC087661]|uniref:DUF3054 domain-containing protein n=1 Tax=Glutamicibacter sp. NPDC087661 TaxID=3363996 RepID=UPI00381B0B47
MKDSIRKWPLWMAVDVVLIVLFALLGRREHEHGLSIGGILMTALPFLVAYVVVTLLSKPWTTINKLFPVGVLVWVVTVAAGLALRVAMDSTAALPFIIVATLVLGAFLMGRRLVTSMVAKRLGK